MALSGLGQQQKTGLLPETIRTPDGVAELGSGELKTLADDVRRFLLANISKTGGHIGANLGTVDLTVALHKCFRSPEDAILFDTGHQGYTHKILTGRSHLFPSLNTYGGMNRFLSRMESEHDPIEASHAGTSISIGLGMALARKLQGDPHHVVCVIGDGSLCEGMAFEGLNHAAVEDTNLVLVLNDNGFAISPGFGGLHEALQSGTADAFFRSLGIDYSGPIDGHDIDAMTAALERARNSSRLALVHVKTIKGYGWTPADRHPFRQHFSFPFDPVSGELVDPSCAVEGYQDVAAAVVEDEMERDDKIVCLTASTLYATGLAPVFARFPERCFDPGMEEQHALALTTGFALAGMKPVIAYQSTFLQRAFDQLIHDVCFADLPTLILSIRSGFSGYDNPTHHGIYDFAYLRGLPNLRMLYPKDRHEAERMVRTELRHLSGPTMICMPYGPVDDYDDSVLQETDAAFAEPQVDYEGRELLVLTVGNKYGNALEVVEELREEGIDAGLINLRYLKPLPEDFLAEHIAAARRVVTLEEGVLDGGVGSAIASLVADRGLTPELLRLGLPCKFIEPGSNEELCAAYGLDPRGIHASLERRWPKFFRRAAA